MRYYAKITKQPEGHFDVEFPELEGCFSQGESLRDARAQAYDALNLWLEGHCELDDKYGSAPCPRVRRSSSYYPVEVEPAIASAVILKRVRIELGITRAQFAKRQGMKLAEYNKIELPSTHHKRQA